jgi:ABC-type antimicrobial peptide transport system permease subunit
VRLIREAVRDLRASRIRSLLTGVTLFVGVLSVVAIFTIGSVVRDVFVATEEQKSGRAVTVEAMVTPNLLSSDRLESMLGALDRRIVSQGASYALEAQTGAVVGATSAGGTNDGGDAVLALVAGRLDHVRRLPILEGRWLSPDLCVYPAEVIVNQAGEAQFGGVGATLAVQPCVQQPPVQATIVGVVADGSKQADVYAAMNAMLAYRPVSLEGGTLQLFVHHPAASEGEIEGLTRAALTDIGTDVSNVEIHRYDDVDLLVSNLRTTQRAFLGAAIVLFVVAIIGLLNIGLASVRERAHELVIRRAVGATRARVSGLVLLSGIMIAMAAAVSAVGLAFVAVTFVVPRLLDPAQALNDPAFPWSAAAIGVATGVGAALIGGLLPAIVAARIDVAFALRD